MLVSAISMAQEKSKNKKCEIDVRGNCEMCKKRIEKAAYSVKGVKMANWDVEKEVLSLVINEEKTDLMTVQKKIAAAGHTTKEVVVKQEVYNNLHACCKYDNPSSCGEKTKE